MRYGIVFALGIGLALAGCSDDKKNKLTDDDAGNDAAIAVEPDAEVPDTATDAATDAAVEDDAAAAPDADVAAKLPRAALERPPTGGLPASLRPPR